MKTIGFPIGQKENERRRTVIPLHIKLMDSPGQLYFEQGYGTILGITDDEYKKIGCHIGTREEILQQDIICDPKIGDANYLDKLNHQTIFGWVHATQNKNVTNILVDRNITAYAWEKMFEKGRHVFWRNNELAGEAAIIHAFQCYGRMPYETSAAVIGRGNVARGAIKILNKLGAEVTQYNRYTEDLLREEISNYDVIVNCVLWDVLRKDHIINKSDLKRMKKGSLIIDVSCDKHGAIETSVPTTIKDPVYTVDGILHYVVDHTPSLFYKTFTFNNSKLIYPYLNQLIQDKEQKVLQDALITKDGKVLDPEITTFQNR